MLPFDNASIPAGIVTAPVATAALAVATAPTASVPKWTKPRNCLPPVSYTHLPSPRDRG